MNIMINTDILTEAIDIKSIATKFVGKLKELFNKFKEFVTKLPGKIKEFIKKKIASIKGKNKKPFNINDYKNFNVSNLKDAALDMSDKGYIPNIDFVVSGDYKNKIQNLVDGIHNGVSGLYDEISSDKYLSGEEDEMNEKLKDISNNIDKHFKKQLYDKDDIRGWFFIKSDRFEMGSNPKHTWDSLVKLGDMSDITNSYTKIINKTIDKCKNIQDRLTIGVETDRITSENLKAEGIPGWEIESLYSKRFQLLVNLFGKEITILSNLLSDITKIVTDYINSVIDIEKQITNKMDDPLDSPTIIAKKKKKFSQMEGKYSEIERGIKEGDIKGLRYAICTLIYTDRDFSDGVFDEAVQYVEGKGIKLKDDTLVGKPVISSIKDTYTDDDLARAIFELKRNFCDERIEDVKIICRALYGKH